MIEMKTLGNQPAIAKFSLLIDASRTLTYQELFILASPFALYDIKTLSASLYA